MWEAPLGQFSGILPPFNLEADAGDGYVSLSWENPFYTNEISRYNVYRDGEIIFFTNETEFTDIDIVNDTIYNYYITSVNNIGEESLASNTVLAEPKGPKTIPYSEDFENGDGDWQYKNTIADWRLGNASDFAMTHVDGNQTSFFGISSIIAGQGTHTTDSLISPIFDLSTHNYLSLSFDYVLRKFIDYDKLWLLYRTSENSDWTEIAYLPRSGVHWGNWISHSIDLPVGAISSTTQIAFYYDDSNVYSYGAGIDNVQIFENTSSINDPVLSENLKIFPNPNKGEFEINFKQVTPAAINIQIYSSNGKKVYERYFNPSSEVFSKRISISELPVGIYHLRLVTSNNIYLRKITLY